MGHCLYFVFKFVRDCTKERNRVSTMLFSSSYFFAAE